MPVRNTFVSSIQQVTPVQKDGMLHLTLDGKTGSRLVKSFLQSTKVRVHIVGLSLKPHVTAMSISEPIVTFLIFISDQQQQYLPFFHPLLFAGLNV